MRRGEGNMHCSLIIKTTRTVTMFNAINKVPSVPQITVKSKKHLKNILYFRNSARAKSNALLNR